MVASQVSVPTPAECERLWKEYHTPTHIRRHCMMVGRVARRLADELTATGETVNGTLCEAAGLLHDLIRVTEWEELSFDFFDAEPPAEDIAVWEQQRTRWLPDVPHAQVNEEVLRDAYPVVAAVIAKHSVSSVSELETWEEKVVHYADRRVMHDQFVSIEERFADFAVRYPHLDPDDEALNATRTLERDLFLGLSITPAELTIRV